MIYLSNLNLSQNELQNAVIQPLATAPASAKLGQIYCDSTSSKIKMYDGTTWKTVGVVVEASEANGNIKVDGVEMTVYELPVATSSVRGGIIVGRGLKVDADGVLTRDVCYYSGIRAAEESDNAAITRILNGAAAAEGDVCVVKTLIAGEKYSYASFVYDEGQWNAMDGNVDAENVILREDITTAGDYTQVGNVTKGKTATGSISAAGKSIKDVFQAIFTKELNPSKTEPSVSITLDKSGIHEVGSTVAVSYSATLKAGSYTYGPATGITASSWSIKDNASTPNTSTTASGTFDSVVVTDDTDYKITATATHNAGAIPVTNLGNEYASAQIAAGSKSATSGAITGFRKYFYGTNASAVALNSANIRALTHSEEAVGTSKTFEMPIPDGTRQVIIAFPSSINKTLSSVIDKEALGTNIFDSFVKSTVEVEGASAGTGVNYDVYVYAPETALGANTYTVTIS